ncbi:hypothetical protein OsI_23051 [Oryza sativa Indica Group]|uniref:Uncharacterized protein n=1 Tax=Oryza sativa subsp. indica TaxID=39946 RepID=B8B2S5_ORYSI|nr:hypothetical protein OsI_23051 [Oryza sativa Indica Group]
MASGDEEGSGSRSPSKAAPAPAPAKKKKTKTTTTTTSAMAPLPLAEVKWILAQKREPYTNPDDIEGFKISSNPNNDNDDGFPEELKASCRDSIRRSNILRKVADDRFFEYQSEVRAAMESSGRFLVDAGFFERRARGRAKLNEAWAKLRDGLPLSDSDSDADEEDDEDMALLAAVGLEFD